MGHDGYATTKKPQKNRWEELMNGAVLRWTPETTRVSTHILAFDMDGTLIKTKSGQCRNKFGTRTVSFYESYGTEMSCDE